MSDRKPYRHRFPLSIIGYALWLYHRFPLSQQDVQELLFEQGIQASHEKAVAVEYQIRSPAHRGTASLGILAPGFPVVSRRGVRACGRCQTLVMARGGRAKHAGREMRRSS